VFDFLDNLFNSLSQIGAELAQIFAYLVSLIVQVFVFIWTTLVNVFNFLYKIGTSVGKFFAHIWTGFFKKIFTSFMAAVNKAHLWLEAHLRPIIDFLKKARAYYDRIFRLYLKPILDLLQKVRKFLAVLRFLHISWAQALDRRISQIESYVSRLFLDVRAIFNGLIDVLNSIADPMRLIRHPTLVLSLRRVFLSSVRVFTGLPPGYFFPSPRKGARLGTGPIGHGFLESDPSMNPAASSYLPGDDGLGGFNGFLAGEIPDDGAVDDLELLDYFDDSLYPAAACADINACVEALFNVAERGGIYSGPAG
jgi:hypothetical protein